MNSETLLQRARLLIEQNRPQLAAEQLRQLLASDPNVAEAHSLLALCLLENKDQWYEATREAELGVGLAPDDGFSHYILAATHDKRNRFPEALAAIDQAIELAPHQSQYYGLKSSVLAQQRDWRGALEWATTGLSIDPEDETCASIRAIALERLGKTDDAIEQANAAVARNPDSSQSHTTRGWALLNSGKYREAELAFREALRLSPTNEMARMGMIQSLNNHHLLFRWVYRFYMFLGRMGGGARWAIILGLFLGVRVLQDFARRNPEWGPYVLPISVLYLAFCLLSWIATPLFNTFLRFHPLGKYLLSSREKWASNLIAALAMAGLGAALFQTYRGDYGGAILILIAAIFLSLPVSTAFEVDQGWPRKTAITVAIVLSLLCLNAIIAIILDAEWTRAFGLYGLGILLFSFFGNYLRSVTVRR